MIARSMGSLLSGADASATVAITAFSVMPGNAFTSATLIAFSVIVPVLSEHRISIPAIPSIAESLLTIASFRARTTAPTARETVRTAGKAVGMTATMRMRANWSVSGTGADRASETRITTLTSEIARTMR